MERRQVLFRGRVQGVGFRATALSIAHQYPLTGWVRNEADGSVLLEAQGKEGDIEAFLAAIAGEMGPLITDTQIAALDLVEGERSFDVRT